jgi:hypothetical protein
MHPRVYAQLLKVGANKVTSPLAIRSIDNGRLTRRPAGSSGAHDKRDAFEVIAAQRGRRTRPHPVRGDGGRQVAPANWCSMSPGLEHSLSAPSLICRRRCLRHNTGSRSHFPNRIPQTARHVVVGHLIERHRIHWWRHPREARPFDRRCVNDCACLDQSRSYRPARPRNLVFHRGSPFCCRGTSTSRRVRWNLSFGIDWYDVCNDNFSALIIES